MNTQLIVQEDNIRAIISNAPTAHADNVQSHDRCLAVAETLINRIMESGMTDELDQEAASFLERTRKTVTKMNEKRSHVTKLFDTIRGEFTRLESELSDKSRDTLPGKIKVYRDEYARKKHEEAERRRREEQQRQALRAAEETYRADIEAEYREELSRAITTQYNELNNVFSACTIDSIDQFEQSVRSSAILTILPQDFFKNIVSRVMVPSAFYGMPKMAPQLRDQILSRIEPSLREQFTFEMQSNIQSILDMIPSKRSELQRIANLDAEAKAKAEEQMRQREAEEARRREELQRQAAEAERLKTETVKQQAAIGDMFEQAAIAAQAYQPKTTIKKRIVIDDPRGFLAIMNMWWAGEGCTLSVDELSKKFKTMITYCEKLANDKSNPQIIENQFVRYEDEVKAK